MFHPTGTPSLSFPSGRPMSVSRSITPGCRSVTPSSPLAESVRSDDNSPSLTSIDQLPEIKQHLIKELDMPTNNLWLYDRNKGTLYQSYQRWKCLVNAIKVFTTRKANNNWPSDLTRITQLHIIDVAHNKTSYHHSWSKEFPKIDANNPRHASMYAWFNTDPSEPLPATEDEMFAGVQGSGFTRLANWMKLMEKEVEEKEVEEEEVDGDEEPRSKSKGKKKDKGKEKEKEKGKEKEKEKERGKEKAKEREKEKEKEKEKLKRKEKKKMGAEGSM